MTISIWIMRAFARITCTFIVLATLQSGVWVNAQNLADLIQVQTGQIDATIEKLNAQRNQIQQWQQPLAETLREKEAELAELKKQLNIIHAARDSASLSLNALEENVAGKQREADYIIQTLFPEVLSNLQSSLSPGQLLTDGEVMRELGLFLEDPANKPDDKISRALGYLDGYLAEFESGAGPRQYDGDVVAQNGNLIPGTFIQAGPLLYFASEDRKSGGWVGESQSMRPELQSLGKSGDALIIAFADGKSDELPIDGSLGQAVEVSQSKDSIMEHLKKGGIWVYPILAFALISTFAALIKLVQIFSIREPQPLIVHDLVKMVRDGKNDEALKLAGYQPLPSRTMLVAAVEHAGESIELVEEVMYESMLSIQPRLERFLNVIALTAATAPLLGLLGTVTGIIKTFRLMKVYGAGDPKPLISGISEALITTELGLILAIPSLVLHSILSRKVSGVMARLEKLSIAFVNGLARNQSSYNASGDSR